VEDSLKKRYLIKLVASIVAGLVNAVIVAIVPKSLGPLAYGQFTFLQQFFSQIIAFLDAGTSIAFFTKLSAQKNKDEIITYYFFFSLLLLLILVSLVSIFDLLGIEEQVIGDIPVYYLYLGLWLGFFTWLTQIFIKISDAYALTVSVEIMKVAHKLLALLALLVLVYGFQLDLELFFNFNYFASVSFLILISLIFIKKSVFSKSLCTLNVNFKALTVDFYRYASPIFIFNVVGVSVVLFDLWLVQSISGSVEMGFYGLAFSIAAMCSLFTTAMTPIIMREFSKLYSENNLEKMKELYARYVPMLYSVSAFFGVFIAFESENIINIFTDARFEGALYALVVMSFYPLHQTYGQLTSSVFFASGRTSLYRNIGLVVSLVGLVLSGVLVYNLELGAFGFALKMVLIQILGVNVQLFFNVKFLGLKIYPFIKHQILAVLFFSIIAVSVKNLFVFEVSPLWEFLFSGLVYSFISLIGFLIFPSVFNVTRSEILSTYNKFKVYFKV